MKINGAKSIDDLDKLNSNNLSINKLEDIKELEIQAEVQQQQDLEKANLLSEQKSGKNGFSLNLIDIKLCRLYKIVL